MVSAVDPSTTGRSFGLLTAFCGDVHVTSFLKLSPSEDIRRRSGRCNSFLRQRHYGIAVVKSALSDLDEEQYLYIVLDTIWSLACPS